MTGDANVADKTREIAERHGARPELLIQILHDVQEHFRFVSEDAVVALAKVLNLSRAEVHGVVSYYHDFRKQAPGRHVVKICQAEACQAMGSRTLTQHAEHTLGVRLHGSNEDVTLEPVYCLGNCACAPAAMIDGKTHGRVSAERFDALMGQLGDKS